MQVYGCNIGSLYGVDETFDIFLVGLPSVPKKEVTVYLWERNIDIDLPEALLNEIKLMIFNQDTGECNLFDVEVDGKTLLIGHLLKQYGVGISGLSDKQVLHRIDKNVITIGKYGFCAVSMKYREKECQTVYLKSACFNVLDRKMANVKYIASIVPAEKKSSFSTVLRKIVNGSKLEEKDFTRLFINDEEIVEPFHVDFVKNFEMYTPDFSFIYNPIAANIEIVVQGEKFDVKEDAILDFPDMYISKICSSIKNNTLKEVICTYLV